MVNHTAQPAVTSDAGATGTLSETVTTTLTQTVGAAPRLAELEWWQNPQGRFVATILAMLVGWLLVKVADRALIRSASRVARLRHLDEQRTRALVGRTKPMRFVIRLLMLTVVIIAILGIWGLKTAFTGLLAGAGFAGIVVGLAAADTIGDIIAGFLIFYNHPFDIGDWVDVDGVEGLVDDVALGATTILTFDNEKVTIPNRLIESTKVKNYSARRRLRRRLQVGVEYGSDLQKAKRLLVELAEAHPDVFDEPAPSVISVGFGNSSVDLQLRFFVEPVRSNAIAVYTDLVEQVHDTFRREGVNIAFPHMQIVQGRPWSLAQEAA